MIIDDRFNSVLVEPCRQGANKLYIVSGYATSAMAFHHMMELNKNNYDFKIELIIGMCVIDGLSDSNHKGFVKLVENDFVDNFKCSYVINKPPVHSKVYSWYKDDEPVCGFIGSANYSQRAFSEKQREVLAPCDSIEALEYFNSLSKDSIYCNHNDAEEFITLTNEKQYSQNLDKYKKAIGSIDDTPENLLGLKKVSTSFLDNKGNLPQISGLNWGQRPEREPNQAYIKLNSNIYNSPFFPNISVHFTVLTDDHKVLICTRAQAHGKAIETPHNNSLIGEYFRNRLGLSSGQLVLKSHLESYGRSGVDFYKIDDETYFMDFSV